MREELKDRILDLKAKRNAVILAHNYQIGEVQDLADYVGDSLGLSQQAAKVDARVIIFCGVHFMAETASILCPDKKVVMPDINAGCPMADMITVEDLLEEKRKHPSARVECYVNTSAAVKAESDVCCTSANAQKVAESITDSNDILFIPDKYLGHYTSTKVPSKRFILWKGFCPTHVKIIPEDVLRWRKDKPSATILVHPECLPGVCELADHVVSTGGMCRLAQELPATEFVIGTEIGIMHRLRKENPGKTFYPLSKLAVCPNMKMTTLEKVLWALEDLKEEVRVPEEIRIPAKQAIDRMLGVGRGSAG